MTTKDLDLAREWANTLAGSVLTPSEKQSAAMQVIQSLPDHVIDADRVREMAAEIRGEYPPNTAGHQLCSGLAKQLEALLAPPLPTLADLIEQGNDPAKYQWMQCGIGDTSRVGVITGYDEVGEFEYCTSVTFRDEADTWFDPSLVIPLLDLPRLEWPAQEPRNPENPPAETLNSPSSDTPRNPRPEDVPAGEAWIVLCGGQEWVGVRASGLDEHVPWSIIRMNGLSYRDVSDSDIALVSRLAPEVKP